ncbi:hypothetical protein [Serratia sp. AKBS12]|uniref:hypothetical protein n=1 Tax=Serratia sp. AKBS12 TaxID=2974597 RepID=UPI0021668515|nr:hypothetical protein [Serratia sp. AKBS12]MCS3407667.1 hypothetical protein [Serratia sp. AKBS12]HEI8867501.1 hypothetical protein [Serratia odorifera]
MRQINLLSSVRSFDARFTAEALLLFVYNEGASPPVAHRTVSPRQRISVAKAPVLSSNGIATHAVTLEGNRFAR